MYYESFLNFWEYKKKAENKYIKDLFLNWLKHKKKRKVSTQKILNFFKICNEKDWKFKNKMFFFFSEYITRKQAP